MSRKNPRRPQKPKPRIRCKSHYDELREPPLHSPCEYDMDEECYEPVQCISGHWTQADDLDERGMCSQCHEEDKQNEETE